MNILIVGGGSIGYIVAEYFSREGHNVTVIEQDDALIQGLQNALDVNVIRGTGSDIAILKAAGIDQARLFLALTDNDEVNIITCTYAKRAGVPVKIARLNQSIYLTRDSASALKDLGVDEIVDTEKIIIKEILKLVKYPGAADIKYFLDGKYAVAILSFNRDSVYYGKTLGEIPLNVSVLPLGYTKVSDFKPYDPVVIINEFLYVYYACRSKDLRLLHGALFPDARKIKRAMIFGSGYKTQDTNIDLGLALKEQGVHEINLVEENPKKAQHFSAQADFPVILGDPSKPSFAQTERLKDQDAYIALSDNFEKNLFSCSVAFKERVPYTISLVRYPEHVNFVSEIPLTSFINPALVSANKIMKYHRIDRIISRTILGYDQTECIEAVLSHKSKLVGKKIADLPLQNSRLLAIRRRKRFIDLQPDLVLKPKDHILFFLVEAEKEIVKDIIGR